MKMEGMKTSRVPSTVGKITNRRETRGMRAGWEAGVKGLMTVLRVLPEDLYNRVMLSDENIQPGEIFEAIVKRSDQLRARSS